MNAYFGNKAQDRRELVKKPRATVRARGGGRIKAACPSETPATPPSRLNAVGKRLHAMLRAVETVRPALDDFCNALTDDQRARFNTVGQQLFAANR